MSEASTPHFLKRSATFPSSYNADMMRPGIAQTSTFDSSSADEGDRNLAIRRSHSTESDENDDDNCIMDDNLSDLEKGPISVSEVERISAKDALEVADGSLFASWEEIASHVYFISTLAIFGTVTRVYVGRFFGLDCLLNEHNMLDERDFFTPASSLLCITSDGKLQRGGALFIDLPANVLGSFIMGLISPKEGSPPLPWLRADHPLQKHTALHVGLQVGFCGCLTTFSSWNNQMVIMMDGTDSEFGPQVGTAIFGYLLGVACAISSFIFGRYVYEWVRCQPVPPTLDEVGAVTVMESLDHVDDCKTDICRKDRQFNCKSLDFRVWMGVAVVALLAAFVYEDVAGESLAYREMWMAALLTPCGALLRWRLSELNENDIGRIRTEWTWFPRGTFAVNVVAAVLCAFIEAFLSRNASSTLLNWVSPSLRAVETGFAGSLSTVSTLVREMLSMETPGKASRYCLATIVCSMLLSLLVYSPMIRTE